MRAWVYILTNRRQGTLYIGVTTVLQRRMAQHASRSVNSFSKEHNLHRLVYVEAFAELYAARVRERRLKKWNRAWKIRLIESCNPYWRDLSKDLLFI